MHQNKEGQIGFQEAVAQGIIYGFLSKNGISAKEMKVLFYIQKQATSKKMKEYGEIFDLAFSKLTTFFDKLETQKFIKRTQSKEDRRVVLISITNKGVEATRQFMEYRLLVNELFFLEEGMKAAINREFFEYDFEDSFAAFVSEKEDK